MIRKGPPAAGKFKRAGAVSPSGPDFAEACFGHGNYLVSQGRLAEAADLYRSAIAVRPNHADALTNLGNILYQLGQAEEAIEAWWRVTTVAPDHPLPHLNLGIALSKLGKPDLSRNYPLRHGRACPWLVPAIHAVQPPMT